MDVLNLDDRIAAQSGAVASVSVPPIAIPRNGDFPVNPQQVVSVLPDGPLPTGGETAASQAAGTPFVSSIASIVDYNKIILKVTSDLHQLRDFATEIQLDAPIIQGIDEVVQRIETNCFSVAVVGEFKRGKSTFINALLGKAILPSDVLPTTATLNRVTYGVTPLVKLAYKDGHVEEIGIDRMVDYVTKLSPESEERAANIKEAEVFYPLEILRQHVDIFDTPGLNDSAVMTEVTLSVLPKIDAAIMVIMPDSPFSNSEQEFLNKLLGENLGRVIFLITAIDRMEPEDRPRIVEDIRKRISQTVERQAELVYGKDTDDYRGFKKKIGPPRVFTISGKSALKGIVNHDAAQLNESGFPTFMGALERFLTEERGVIVLKVIVDRIKVSSKRVLEKIGIQKGALTMRQEDFNRTYAASVAEIKTLRERQKEELSSIDEAVVRTREMVRPLLEGLEGEIKEAAVKAVDAAPLTPADLKDANHAAFMEKMAKRVSDALQGVSKTLSEKMQAVIQRELVGEAGRLQAFSSSVGEVLRRIEMQFVDIEASSDGKRDPAAEGIVAALSVMTGMGGMWSGYKAAGVKGGVAGAVGSFGTFVGTGMLIALVGLPISWPVIIAAGVISIFTGGWLAKAIFPKDATENFKTNYKAEVLNQIDVQLKAQRVDRIVNDHITESFEALKRRVKEEVETALDQTQRNLDDLNLRRQRNETMTEGELANLEKIAIETQRILGHATRLEAQLAEIVNV